MCLLMLVSVRYRQPYLPYSLLCRLAEGRPLLDLACSWGPSQAAFGSAPGASFSCAGPMTGISYLPLPAADVRTLPSLAWLRSTPQLFDQCNATRAARGNGPAWCLTRSSFRSLPFKLLLPSIAVLRHHRVMELHASRRLVYVANARGARYKIPRARCFVP